MNKKAQLREGIFYIVALFTVAIIFVVGSLILNEVNNNFQESGGISPVGKQLTGNLQSKYVGIMDNAFLMIFIVVLIGVVIGSWFVKTHPALFWILIPIFAFMIFLSAIYANVYFNFSNNAKMADAAAQFTIIPFILNNYAYVITGAVFLIAVALFAKGKGQGAGPPQ